MEKNADCQHQWRDYTDRRFAFLALRYQHCHACGAWRKTFNPPHWHPCPEPPPDRLMPPTAWEARNADIQARQQQQEEPQHD